MAGDAGLRNPQKSFAHVCKFDFCALRSRNMLGRMAAIACQTKMLPLQSVSGLPMVKGASVPFGEYKILSVMLGMATGALLAGTRLDSVGGMQPPTGCYPRANLGVTLDAFVNRLARAQFVTRRAVRWTIERLVRSRKGAGRNLCPRYAREREQ